MQRVSNVAQASRLLRPRPGRGSGADSRAAFCPTIRWPRAIDRPGQAARAALCSQRSSLLILAAGFRLRGGLKTRPDRGTGLQPVQPRACSPRFHRPCAWLRPVGNQARYLSHLGTIRRGGDIRAVAADVSPWQGSPHPANGHRLTSAATVVGSSGDERHDEKMRPRRGGRGNGCSAELHSAVSRI